VARLEKELWAALSVAEFDMIHMQPKATAELDRAMWEEVFQAFAGKIPQLRKLA
jgi:hypothetical protein